MGALVLQGPSRCVSSDCVSFVPRQGLNIQEFCEPVGQLLLACNQPLREYLCHRHRQTAAETERTVTASHPAGITLRQCGPLFTGAPLPVRTCCGLERDRGTPPRLAHPSASAGLYSRACGQGPRGSPAGGALGVPAAPTTALLCLLGPVTGPFSHARPFIISLRCCPQELSEVYEVMKQTHFSTRLVTRNPGSTLEAPGELLKRTHVRVHVCPVWRE